MMTSEQVGGIVRALLAAIGGLLVGKGYVDNGTVTAVVGALTTIAVSVWSWHTNKPA